MNESKLKQLLLYEVTDSGMKDGAGKPIIKFVPHGNIAPIFEAAGVMPFMPGNGMIFRVPIKGQGVNFQVSWTQYDPISKPQVAYVIALRFALQGPLSGPLQVVDPGSEKTTPEYADKPTEKITL